MRLYKFWASIKVAPAEIKAIMMDLLLLTNALEDCAGTIELSATGKQTMDYLAAKIRVNASVPY